ncbi:MAG: M23 family metallopeptidase [Candidatus Levybacteria bacterium]|nr:M23 family metallopeptidase [Candidatus Levybacteria bacterium]
MGKRLFVEFGYLVKNDKGKKILPSPIYFLPKGTKVIAVGPGKVLETRSQKDSNDYEVLVEPKDSPGWRISYDHLENIRFKNGDFVNTGDIVGEVPLGYNSEAGNFPMTEITVFIEGTKPEDIENFCPYMLLDKSVKDMYAQKITKLVQDWESYMGDTNIYDEHSWVFPGCKHEKLNEADTIN